jgi:hypothetical protein
MSRDRTPDPSAVGIVRRTQAALVAIAIGSSALWGATVGLVVFALTTYLPAALLAAIVTAVVQMWRDRGLQKLERVALWIEEHQPALQFALVTAVDPHYAVGDRTTTTPPIAALAGFVAAARIDVSPFITATAVRRVGQAALSLGATLVLTAILPAARPWDAISHGAARALHGLRLAPAASHLAGLTATVIPPAYSRLPRQELREPTEISTLIGSAVLLHGHGGSGGLHADIGGESLPVADVGGGWQVSITMPALPALVRILDSGTAVRGSNPVAASPLSGRLITLVPVIDAPPTVELLTPTRDSVMRHADGVLTLGARVTDDIGLHDAYFEIIITAGDEDQGGVQGRTVQLTHRALGDVRAATLDGVLPLRELAPGAVVSIRAVAHDGNTVSGPGVGTSETRTLRIATPDEYDTTTIAGVTVPAVDSSLLSERVVILETTELITRMEHRPSLLPDSVMTASHRLAQRQDVVRGGLSAIVSVSEEDALPVVDALSPPERALLDTALHAMDDASGELAATAPRRALRSERRALAMLDSARALAKRLYFRGRPPRILVNVGRVRLTGAADANPSFRTRGRPQGTQAVEWRRRFAAAVALLGAGDPPRADRGRDSARGAAADSLIALRVDALASNAALATALADAVRAIEDRRDATSALSRARTALANQPTTGTALRAAWTGR